LKVGIVGSGFVGSTAAYSLVMRSLGHEIVLVDKNATRAKAEADDILHAVPFVHPIHVSSGDYADLDDCRVVVISAGVSQRPGETRLQLLERNTLVFKEVIPNIVAHAFDAILLVATNPVDIMTHVAAYLAGFHGVPASRIIGSGTSLDTARFRVLLGEHLGVDPQHVHAYVVGEHGDSEVLTWSLIRIGGIPLEDFCRERRIVLDETKKQDIDQRVRQAAYNIIAGKGATYYGIGSALVRIIDVILHDHRSILTVCSPTSEVVGVRDVTLSLPHLLGGKGIMATIQLPLCKEEEEALRKSAETVKRAIDSISF